MNLNREELVIGFLAGISLWPIVGLWAFPTGLLTGYLWALGGSVEKAWRRFGVSILACLLTGISVGFSWFLAIPLAASIGILSVGYGTPSGEDEGSVFGRWLWKLTDGNEGLCWFISRATVLITFCLIWNTYSCTRL